MPAFDFPNPPTPDQEVTNDATGVTYRYDAATQSWVIVTSQSATNIANDVAQLQSDVNTLETLLPLETSARQQGDANLQSQIDNLDDYDLTPIYAAIETEATTRQLADEDLQNQIDGIDVGDIDLSDYYTKTEVDAVDNDLQAQIDELAITKGTPYAYTLKDIGLIVASRPGDMYVDNTVVKNVNFISLADEDLNGNDRPFGQLGDIVELVKTGGVKYRFAITTAGEGLAGVEFIYAADEDDLLIAGMTFQVFVYPQNSATASKEYVDAELATKLSITGGEMTGSLDMNGAAINTNALVKSTRTSGYAFQVYDEETDSNPAFLHSNGNIRGAAGTFTSTLEVRDAATFKKNIDCDQAINVTGSVNSNGGWVTGNWGFETPGKGLRWYSVDRNDHLADITFQTAKLENLMYDDYLWTLKVQNSGNTDSKTLIYGDYSSGLILNNVGEIQINGNIDSDGHFFTKGGSFRIDKTDGTKQFQIYPNGSDYGATVYSYNNGYFKVRIAEGDTQSPYKEFIDCQTGDHEVGGITHPVSTQINWLKTPSLNHHAANKQYVDDMGQIYYGSIVPSGSDVHDGDLWVDSGNMRLLMRASGAWVNPDREADTDSFKANATPNGRKFGFSSGTGAVIGKLNYYDSGGLKLRLSNTDAFGIKWNDGGITEDVTMSSGPYFTITEVVNDTNHKIIRQGRVSRIDYHGGDILCHLSSHRTNGSFSTSKEYWVNIGGII